MTTVSHAGPWPYATGEGGAGRERGDCSPGTTWVGHPSWLAYFLLDFATTAGRCPTHLLPSLEWPPTLPVPPLLPLVSGVDLAAVVMPQPLALQKLCGLPWPSTPLTASAGCPFSTASLLFQQPPGLVPNGRFRVPPQVMRGGWVSTWALLDHQATDGGSPFEVVPSPRQAVVHFPAFICSPFKL